MPRCFATLVSIVFVVVSARGTAAQASPPDLTDPEVAHVAVTANTIDIELARFAQKSSTNAEVLKFASNMIADHTGVNTQAGTLATRLHVDPKDNAVSQSLVSGAATARADLEKLKGRAFDRGYIDREVVYHHAVLDALDTVLIPTTSNADLKRLLVEVRPAIAAHLAHAERLQQLMKESK